MSMIPMIEPVLYIDPQKAKPVCFCCRCGGEIYHPACLCPDCEDTP